MQHEITRVAMIPRFQMRVLSPQGYKRQLLTMLDNFDADQANRIRNSKRCFTLDRLVGGQPFNQHVRQRSGMTSVIEIKDYSFGLVVIIYYALSRARNETGSLTAKEF